MSEGQTVEAQLEASGFGVATGQRCPCVRLSATTRTLAAHYLSGAVGRSVKPAEFAIAGEFLLTVPTPNQHYAEAVRLIAQNAPLRLLPGEKLAGAATLQEAMWHRVPLTPFDSISHTTLGFEKALRLGLQGIRGEIELRLRRGGLDPDGEDLLRAMLTCLAAARVWHGRHVAAIEELILETTGEIRRNYQEVLDSLRPVPEAPPRTFRQAVQALWLLWDFQRLCGNWSGLGRIDQMLGPYLDRDLADGRITLDEARELLAHFWIKGCEWITAEGRGSGDAQFYQNIVLAGVDTAGRPVANQVTELVLDVVGELHISDFPIAVRVSRDTPEALLRRVAAIQRLGGGIVAIYNDDRIIPSLVGFGYPVAEARDYANDGCWEILVPGKTSFGYQPFDVLLLLQETLGLTAGDAPRNQTPGGRARLPDYPDFEALYAAFRLRLARQVAALVSQAPFSKQPCPLLSLLVDDCIERGRSYADGGPRYTVRSPHAGGLPDTANGLLAIRRLVYEEKALSLAELVCVLQSDWAGHEELRQRVWSCASFYGNDDAAADGMLRRVFDDFTGLVGQVRERFGVLRPAGISTFGREGSDFLRHRAAVASGQRKGAILAPNFSASPGTDRRGPTALIKSHCSVDFSRLPCGTALDLKLLPLSIEGEDGLRALTGLMQSFVSLGGVFLQIDVVDTELLRAAQQHPERFPNLSVRISGWSARFATLSKEWQDIIIARTQQAMGH